ncbi:heat shock 70 kDa protein cognate 5-like [Planococcus citri]|uniref:heat shock 70 kDa protein cognate 5-like n=1 Tax=Planococcus citri TaxID=170843 RepID=UPI0031F9B832
MLHGHVKYASKGSFAYVPPIRRDVAVNSPINKVVVGIDLGGTRTRVAIMHPSRDDVNVMEPIVVRDMPSVVSILPDGKCIVGWYAEKRKLSSPLNTFHGTRRLTGRRYNDPVVIESINRVKYHIYESPDGHAWLVSTNRCRIFTPAQIEALLILKIKEICEEHLNSYIPVDKVVLTVPPYFNDSQVQIAKRVGKIAGVDIVDVISSPVAAVLAYSSVSNIVQDSKITAVYDFGGSTFNLTVLKVCEGVTFPEVIFTVGDLFLGGENFDEVLSNYFASELKRILGIDVTLCTTFKQFLKEAAENAKKDLSIYTEVDVKFWSTNMPKETPKVDDVIIKLTRDKFEVLVADLINKTINICQTALKDAKISVSDVHEVLAIGGTCRIPKVRSAVESIFGKPPVELDGKIINRGNAVAAGAALRAYDLRDEISHDPDELPGPPINIPNPVTETELFTFIMSDGKVDVGAIQRNTLKKNILYLHTEEQADLYIMRLKLCMPLEPGEDVGDVHYIKTYHQKMEWRREMEERPRESIEKYIETLRIRKDKFVQNEITRELSSSTSEDFNFDAL